MHFHLPKPLHGWRAFTGEVGIIVIGVLIALAAEQAVENWRWRTHVAEAKDDLRTELYQALYDSRERATGQRCVERKLDRLETILDQPSPPSVSVGMNIAPIRPWSTSAWDSAVASDAVAHMKPEERSQYAAIYSMVRSTRDLNFDEFKAATQLAMLRHGGTLTDQSRDRLRSAVAELRGYNALLGLGGVQLSRQIHILGIALEPEDELTIIGVHCRMPDEPDTGIP